MARDDVELSNYFWLYKVRSTVKCDFALWKDPCPQCKGLSWHLCKPRGDIQLLQVGHDSLVPRAVDLGWRGCRHWEMLPMTLRVL